jgi:hypothetical protein
MSSRSGLRTIICKYSIPSTVGGVAYTNGGAPITQLDSGRWLATVAYAIDPVTAGATLPLVSYSLTLNALIGGGTASGVLQHYQSAATPADVNNKSSNCAVFLVTADNTPVYFSLTATTSAGNYITSSTTLDAPHSVISFVKLE